jgi:hypothetical protein
VADDGVSSGEMRWPAAQTDPIDAVLDDVAVDDDLLDVAAVVHDIRAAYLPAAPLRRSDALAAFTDARLDAGDDLAARPSGRPDPTVAGVAGGTRRTERRRRTRTTMLTTVSGFVGTLTGKVVLGTAVAAAGVGGLHAADVAEVPILPAHDSPAADDAGAAGQGQSSSPAAGGIAGQMTAAEKQAAADAHAGAVRAWTDCVAGAAAARGDADTRTHGAFDPRATCGDMPTPAQFGLTDLPDQAADSARTPGRTPGATATDGPATTDRASGGADAPPSDGVSPTPRTAGAAPTQPGAVPDGAGSADATTGGPAGGHDDAAGERH